MEVILPPNQHLAAPGKWPVVGEKAPRVSSEPWTVSVCGLVENPRVWTLEELSRLPQLQRSIDIHCVTRWSRLGARFSGVRLRILLDDSRPLSDARFVSFGARSERNHSTSLPLADALDLDSLIALEHEGGPLQSGHGGPVRMVVPGRYFYKSVKWLERIELIAEDRPGYWEAEAGYHNGGEPWSEQRYIAPNLDRNLLRRVLEARDFCGLDLRSIQAAGLDLAGLKAEDALLRDADFRRSNLAAARFDRANLSNAHFDGANLSGASFWNSDVEGADFRGADLCGADFTGASLLGVTFSSDGSDGATMDSSTRFDVQVE